MIILTEEQALKVKGISPNDSYKAIIPIPLKDGSYLLGEEVLSDPAHRDVRDLLASAPKLEVKDFDRAKLYADSDTIPAGKEVDLRTLGVRKVESEGKTEDTSRERFAKL